MMNFMFVFESLFWCFQKRKDRELFYLHKLNPITPSMKPQIGNAALSAFTSTAPVEAVFTFMNTAGQCVKVVYDGFQVGTAAEGYPVRFGTATEGGLLIISENVKMPKFSGHSLDGE